MYGYEKRYIPDIRTTVYREFDEDPNMRTHYELPRTYQRQPSIQFDVGNYIIQKPRLRY